MVVVRQVVDYLGSSRGTELICFDVDEDMRCEKALISAVECQ